MDANTHTLSTLTTPNVSVLKPNIDTTKLEPDTSIVVTDAYSLDVADMTTMDPYEAEALMTFIAPASYNGLSSKGDTLIINTATSHNFVRKEFIMANGF